MRIVNPDLAIKMIEAGGLDRVTAWDMKRECVLYSHKGDSDSCVAAVHEMVAMINGTFRLEAEKGSTATHDGRETERGGRRTIGGKIVVLLQGSFGQGSTAIDARMDRLERLLLGEGSDEGEDPPEAGSTLNDTLAELLKQGLPLILARLGGQPGQPITGPPQPPPAARPDPSPGPGDGEAAQIARAITRLRKADPATYKQMLAHLLNTYGDAPTQQQ